MELINNIAKHTVRFHLVFRGCRRAYPWRSMTSTTRWKIQTYLDKVAMVYGQMNEPPGNRLRVALTGLTMAEYFRHEKMRTVRVVTYYCFRWQHLSLHAQAGTEVSALLGQAASAVGISQRLQKRWVYYKNAITSTQSGLYYLGPSGIRPCWWLDWPITRDNLRTL